MPRYLFVSTRTTEFEDYIEADTQEEAVEIYEELIADDLTIVNQYFEYPVYASEVSE
jgi:hypothetical protein